MKDKPQNDSGCHAGRALDANRAFTLIELLVVVAIVGMLTALLLPALAGAKADTWRAQCQSNLKQLATGFRLFEQDHNEMFPAAGSTGTGQLTWDTYIYRYIGGSAGDFWLSQGVLPIEFSLPIDYCPTDAPGQNMKVVWIGNPPWNGLRSYAMAACGPDSGTDWQVDSQGGKYLEAAFARAGHADAVFNVHLNGQCGAIEEIAGVARAHGAKIVDDSCHALGTGYVAGDGHVSGIGSNAFCDLSVFSFHPVKAIAMGEGGAVTANDPELAKRLRSARNHGMTRDPADFVNGEDAFDEEGNPNPWYYELTQPQFNWRANDIQCALGLSQLGKLGRFVARRRAVAAAYDSLLGPLSPLVRPLARTRPCLPAWHLYAVRIDFESAGLCRAALMRALAAEGIGTQVHYFPVHRQPYYAARYGATDLPGAERYYARALSLPLSAAMTPADAQAVVDTLERLLS